MKQTKANETNRRNTAATIQEVPMLLLSATDLAITAAIERGTLTISEEVSERLGNTFFAISDEHGLIEVHLERADAEERVAALWRANSRVGHWRGLGTGPVTGSVGVF